MRSALLRSVRARPPESIAACTEPAGAVRPDALHWSQPGNNKEYCHEFRTQWMEDIQKNISDLIARSPAADVEKNVRAMMAQAFTKMDLVTREEFDVQADLLARTRARVDQLAAQVQQLEERLSALSK